jgi:DNA mismatch repair protein MutL
MRVIGQAAATYIIAEGPAGLYLVDQHAAHERILYEQFMRDQAKHRPVAQHALSAVTLQLSLEAVRLLEENLEILRAVGFELEPFGGNTIRVRAIPAILADRDPEEAVRVLLDDLEAGEEPAASTQEARIVLRVCKAAAVKAGQTLSYEEMRELMRQLERCESPRTCPHGRPTMIHISAAQLAKEFGRT